MPAGTAVYYRQRLIRLKPGLRSSNECQELRGGHLDHEQHDMSENRETANADMEQGDSAFHLVKRPVWTPTT